MILTPEQAIAKMKRKADMAFRALILEAAKRIIYRTPVDTGRARGNWQVSIGSPQVAEFDDDKNGYMTLMGVRSDTREVDAGEIVYLLNGVEYIVYLERGSSDQHPDGMVAVTVAELQYLAEEIGHEIRSLQ